MAGTESKLADEKLCRYGDNLGPIVLEMVDLEDYKDDDEDDEAAATEDDGWNRRDRITYFLPIRRRRNRRKRRRKRRKDGKEYDNLAQWTSVNDLEDAVAACLVDVDLGKEIDPDKPDEVNKAVEYLETSELASLSCKLPPPADKKKKASHGAVLGFVVEEADNSKSAETENKDAEETKTETAASSTTATATTTTQTTSDDGAAAEEKKEDDVVATAETETAAAEAEFEEDTSPLVEMRFFRGKKIPTKTDQDIVATGGGSTDEEECVCPVPHRDWRRVDLSRQPLPLPLQLVRGIGGALLSIPGAIGNSFLWFLGFSDLEFGFPNWRDANHLLVHCVDLRRCYQSTGGPVENKVTAELRPLFATPASVMYFLRSLLGADHKSSPWVLNDDEDDDGKSTRSTVDAVMVVLPINPAKSAGKKGKGKVVVEEELLKFRVADASPSWYLHSVSYINAARMFPTTDDGDINNADMTTIEEGDKSGELADEETTKSSSTATETTATTTTTDASKTSSSSATTTATSSTEPAKTTTTTKAEEKKKKKEEAPEIEICVMLTYRRIPERTNLRGCHPETGEAAAKGCLWEEYRGIPPRPPIVEPVAAEIKADVKADEKKEEAAGKKDDKADEKKEHVKAQADGTKKDEVKVDETKKEDAKAKVDAAKVDDKKKEEAKAKADAVKVDDKKKEEVKAQAADKKEDAKAKTDEAKKEGDKKKEDAKAKTDDAKKEGDKKEDAKTEAAAATGATSRSIGGDEAEAEPTETTLYRLVSQPFVSSDREYRGALDTLLLKENVAAMRKEAISIKKWEDWPVKDDYVAAGPGEKPWKVFPLCHCVPSDDEDKIEWIQSTSDQVPNTSKLLVDELQSGDGKLLLRAASFGRLEPGASLQSRRGYDDVANHVFRVHLPLVVPDGDLCGTWVDGCAETHHRAPGTVAEGEEEDGGRNKSSDDIVTAFDASKLHRAFNYSATGELIVLVLDLARPTESTPPSIMEMPPDGPFPAGTSTKKLPKEYDAAMKKFGPAVKKPAAAATATTATTTTTTTAATKPDTGTTATTKPDTSTTTATTSKPDTTTATKSDTTTSTSTTKSDTSTTTAATTTTTKPDTTTATSTTTTTSDKK